MTRSGRYRRADAAPMRHCVDMGITAAEWPNSLAVAQVRVARPTDQLDAVVRFYTEGIGLRELARFTDHAGYDGVMLGLPGTQYHLEFTSHTDGSPGAAPSAENLLVLYFQNAGAMDETVTRLREFGVDSVATENPYWVEHGGVAFPDPDGWQVVLMPRPVF